MREVSAAARAAWLADLISALDAARAIVERLADHEVGQGERAALLASIIAARHGARAMQLRHLSRLDGEYGPEWIELSDKRLPRSSGPQTPAGKSPPPENGSR